MRGVPCTAPASQIRKINQGTIEDFPMLFTWLQCTENKESSNQREVSDIESDWETMLEKEIEKITIRNEDVDVKDMHTENLAGTFISCYLRMSCPFGMKNLILLFHSVLWYFKLCLSCQVCEIGC